MSTSKTRSAYDKEKYAAKSSDSHRINFWIDRETAEMIANLSDISGLERLDWIRRAIRTAINLQLLDAQMTEGTIKGGFGKARPSTEKPRQKSAGRKPRKAKS